KITILAPVPVASYGPIDTSGCQPLSVAFTNTSKYANSYAWDFGDGATSAQTNPSHTYYNSGIFIVELIVIGQGGQNSTKSKVTVHEKPQAAFTVNPKTVYIPNDPLLCLNL